MACVKSEVKLYASYILMAGNCFDILLHKSRCASSREITCGVKILADVRCNRSIREFRCCMLLQPDRMCKTEYTKMQLRLNGKVCKEKCGRSDGHCVPSMVLD